MAKTTTKFTTFTAKSTDEELAAGAQLIISSIYGPRKLATDITNYNRGTMQYRIRGVTEDTPVETMQTAIDDMIKASVKGAEESSAALIHRTTQLLNPDVVNAPDTSMGGMQEAVQSARQLFELRKRFKEAKQPNDLLAQLRLTVNEFKKVELSTDGTTILAEMPVTKLDMQATQLGLTWAGQNVYYNTPQMMVLGLKIMIQFRPGQEAIIGARYATRAPFKAHPHAQATGLCTGNNGNIIGTRIRELRIYDAFVTMRLLLNNWIPGHDFGNYVHSMRIAGSKLLDDYRRTVDATKRPTQDWLNENFPGAEAWYKKRQADKEAMKTIAAATAPTATETTGTIAEAAAPAIAPPVPATAATFGFQEMPRTAAPVIVAPVDDGGEEDFDEEVPEVVMIRTVQSFSLHSVT